MLFQIFDFGVFVISLILKEIKYMFKRIFICSHKGHDFIWSGGGFIFHDKNNLRCKHCKKGKHLTLEQLQKEAIKIN